MPEAAPQLKIINKLSTSQVVYLNALRGLASLTVLLGHIYRNLPGNFSFGKTLPWQSLAVVVFFWLSGFLIAYICLTKPNYTFREYFIDRFCRIYVMYTPVMIVSAALLVFLDLRQFPNLGNILGNLFMLQHTPFSRIHESLPTVHVFLGLSPLWTIAIEWWLYLLFGIVYFFHQSSSSARLLMLALLVPSVLVVGYFSLKEYVAITWFMGAACAAIFVGIDRKPKLSSLILAILLSFCGAGYRIYYLSQTKMNMYDIQLSVFITSIIFLSLLAFWSVNLSGWINWVSVKLGFISYALYLSHMTILIIALKYLATDTPTLLHGIYISIICLAVAVLFAYFFENKHLTLRTRIKDVTARPRSVRAYRKWYDAVAEYYRAKVSFYSHHSS